ncbi:hypothetical protein [Streptomyces sp. NPDC056242]|uniref:hypothetical protein n=1 Tax=Streptomyces sp. NPDC056242 TaxID=3345760 RepID=UPI0035DD72BA
MKCGEPNPESSYQECERELEHPGSHQYLNTRWSRPEPADADRSVQELLDATRPRDTWGVDERRYPIVVIETATRIIWVDAENEDKALAYWGDDPTDLSLDGCEVLDGDLEFQRPDRWQRQDAFKAKRREPKIGPLLKCPGCDSESFRREWNHDPHRKCHGPIAWRVPRHGRAYREYQETPAFAGTLQGGGDDRG